MDEKIRVKIREMRFQGYGYGQIAKETGINENTVKTHCRRNGLQSDLTGGQQEKPVIRAKECETCGGVVYVIPGRKIPRFCCSECRNKWWNTHLNEVHRKTMDTLECPTCKKTFYAYANRNRKYCSHGCYITARFG